MKRYVKLSITTRAKARLTFNRSYIIVLWGEEGDRFETLFTGLSFNLYLDYIRSVRDLTFSLDIGKDFNI